MPTHCNDGEDQHHHHSDAELLIGSATAMHTTMSSHVLKIFDQDDLKISLLVRFTEIFLAFLAYKLE